MNSKGKKALKNKRNEKSKRNKSKTDKKYLTENNTKTVYNYNIYKDNKLHFVQENLKKYNYNKQKYELLLVDQLLCNANCRLVSVFKEKMITDFVDEFLHRRYATEESRERLPKFYKYYKNYLVFFCKPIFKDFDFNKLIQNNGEKKAELYYKNNYQQAKSLDNIKDNGFEESDSDSSSDSENNIKYKKDGKIFNESVKEKLENVTIMTTISNGINSTVNLNIDNEKLEVFSENKCDKSNDTTVVDFINNYQKELENKNNKIQKSKNKKNNKKFNHSYILRNYNFSRQKNNNNKIYATSYKVLTNDKSKKKNKLLKIKHNKNKSNDNNQIKAEQKAKKVSIEKILKSNFSNIKDNKYRRELTNSQKETPKINISLKMIHKGYYKLENEMKNNLINYRNHLKDKLGKKGMTTLSTTPFYNKNDNKSRNSNKILYKQSSIGTVSNSVYGTQINEGRNTNSIFSINHKSSNFSSIGLKMKRYKKNIKFINNKGYAVTNLSKKKDRKLNKVNNLFIKTDNTNKLLNQINISNNQNISNTNKEITSENIKNCHNNKIFIRINKNDKLFKKNKNSLKKNNLKNMVSGEIKISNNKDLNISSSNKNLYTIKKDDYIIGDLEEMQLTSKMFKIKAKKIKSFWNQTLITIFVVIISLYLSILYLYPFLTILKNINIRQMTQQNGNFGLIQNYERVEPLDKNLIYIPIVGTDDIHGNFFPKINNLRIGNKTLTYKTGGLEYIARYINILREEFGSNRVLYFDGGDFYQGGIASVIFDGEIMLDFFNLIGLNGSTVGNHEFDYSREWIESKIEKAKYKVLINNIMDNSTHEKDGALGENQERSHLYEIKLENGDVIKIGVIGLSFNMKNDKKMPNTWGNRGTWDNISFFSYIEELEEESNELRQNGASAVIAVTHFGLVCNQTEARKLNMYNKSSIQGQCYREDEDSVLYKLLDVLKPGILDGIIGGDTHMLMHHWEKGIPMMSVKTHARYLNVMYLAFKKGDDGKYYLVPDEVKIEGPLPACEKIFKNYQNCELISSKEYEEAGELISYTWHGKEIGRDPMVQPIYDKYYEKYKAKAEQKIVTFQGFDKIRVDKSGDCILCNTFLDAIKEIKEADFAIINRGIFPEELVPSTLTREDFYNQMPYLDKICTVDVTGTELKKIVGTVQSNGKSFYPSSNLKQTIEIDKSGKMKVSKIEIYVDDEAVPIEDDKIYKMASSMYVLSETSGEDFAKGEPFKIIHEKAINNEISCSTRTIDDEMAEFFKGRGTIDLSNKVSSERPRIIKIIEKSN